MNAKRKILIDFMATKFNIMERHNKFRWLKKSV